MRLFVLLLWLVLLRTDPGLAQARLVSVAEPKAFGYFMGDVLRRRITVDAGANAELIAASVPRPGAISYWLDLRAARWTWSRRAGRRRFEIDLAYQTFYAPLEPKRRVIPAIALRFRDGGETSTVRIAPFTFLTSPLREILVRRGLGAEQGRELPQLMPDVRPRLRPTGRERSALLASAAVGLGALALLAYHFAWWPFRARPHRPFTAAARRIAARAADAEAADLERAYMDLHRAFDATAGHSLLAGDVTAFLDTHPPFAACREGIERFFVASRTLFFAGDARRADSDMPLAELAQLSARLAATERRGP